MRWTHALLLVFAMSMPSTGVGAAGRASKPAAEKGRKAAKPPAPPSAPSAAPTKEKRKGYGDFAWGETRPTIETSLGKKRVTPRKDTAFVVLEVEVRALERSEALRIARKEKKSAKELRKLKAQKPEPARFGGLSYWIDLGRLDAQVVLHFLDDRLWGVDVSAPFDAGSRAQAAEVLDLLARKYGDPIAHRGDEREGAPVVDVFDAFDATLEAFQQPARAGRRGFLRLEYRARDLAGAARAYVDELRASRRDLELARNPPPPTREALDARRREAILKHL